VKVGKYFNEETEKIAGFGSSIRNGLKAVKNFLGKGEQIANKAVDKAVIKSTELPVVNELNTARTGMAESSSKLNEISAQNAADRADKALKASKDSMDNTILKGNSSHNFIANDYASKVKPTNTPIVKEPVTAVKTEQEPTKVFNKNEGLSAEEIAKNEGRDAVNASYLKDMKALDEAKAVKKDIAKSGPEMYKAKLDEITAATKDAPISPRVREQAWNYTFDAKYNAQQNAKINAGNTITKEPVRETSTVSNNNQIIKTNDEMIEGAKNVNKKIEDVAEKVGVPAKEPTPAAPKKETPAEPKKETPAEPKTAKEPEAEAPKVDEKAESLFEKLKRKTKGGYEKAKEHPYAIGAGAAGTVAVGAGAYAYNRD
jgi:hypothetical protein